MSSTLDLMLASLENKEEREFFRRYSSVLLKEGWSMSDVVAFLNCCEEFNPSLDEETALARMATIRRKYL